MEQVLHEDPLHRITRRVFDPQLFCEIADYRLPEITQTWSLPCKGARLSIILKERISKVMFLLEFGGQDVLKWSLAGVNC